MLIRRALQIGFHGRDKWLETDHDLREFLALFKYIAITAVDIGIFNPLDQDRAAGWSASCGIAYPNPTKAAAQTSGETKTRTGT